MVVAQIKIDLICFDCGSESKISASLEIQELDNEILKNTLAVSMREHYKICDKLS